MPNKPEVLIREIAPAKKLVTARVELPRRAVSKARPTLMTAATDAGTELWDMIIEDVVMPGIKGLVADSITEILGTIARAATALIHGDSKAATIKRGRFDYSKASSSGVTRGPKGSSFRIREDHPRDDRRTGDYGSRSRAGNGALDEVVFDSRDEAEEVLFLLGENVSKYGDVTVATYLQLAGVTSQFTDEYWGWKDLYGSKVKPIGRGEYIISLPKPEELR